MQLKSLHFPEDVKSCSPLREIKIVKLVLFKTAAVFFFVLPKSVLISHRANCKAAYIGKGLVLTSKGCEDFFMAAIIVKLLGVSALLSDSTFSAQCSLLPFHISVRLKPGRCAE